MSLCVSLAYDLRYISFTYGTRLTDNGPHYNPCYLPFPKSCPDESFAW